MLSSPWSRCAVLAALAVLLLPARGLAQITVDADEYRARLGQTHSLHLVAPTDSLAFQALAGLTGPDQRFDFTALDLPTPLPLLVGYVPLPDDVPGSDQSVFADADHALLVEPQMSDELPDSLRADLSFSLYRRVTLNGVLTHGLFADVDLGALYLPDSLELPDSLLADSLLPPLDSLMLADTLLAYALPPLRTMALPLTASTAWTSSSGAVATWGELIVPLNASVEAEVDGYGTLVTPDGSEACLRLHSTYTLLIPFTEYSLTFQIVQYVTEGDLSALLVLDEDGVPTLAAYGSLAGPSTTQHAPSTTQLALASSTPHPFRDAATLHYTLPVPAHVRLRLFDLLGRQVTTLVDAPLPAGPHDVRLDATHLPSGLYVARLEAGTRVRTRTLIRMR